MRRQAVVVLMQRPVRGHCFGTTQSPGFADKRALTWQNGNKIFQQPTQLGPTSGTCCPTTSPARSTVTSTTTGTATAARSGLLWNNWSSGQVAFAVACSPARRDDEQLHPRRDPFQYAVADAFTVCDGYHQAIIAPTSATGCTSGPGRRRAGPATQRLRGRLPGRTPGRPRSRPIELLQAAGIDWQGLHQRPSRRQRQLRYFLGDYGDNPLWFYQRYNSPNGGTSQLAVREAVTP